MSASEDPQPKPKPKLYVPGDWKRSAREADEKPRRGEGETSKAEQGSTLHVDADWKAEARAHRERETQAAGAGEGDDSDRPAGLPPADFKTLLSSMVTQALMAMGAVPDPLTGQRVAHLDLARHHVDMLAVLAAKTKGNLEREEEKLITQSLQELRMSYLSLSKQAMAQMAAGEGGGQEVGGSAAGYKPKA